MAEEWGEGGKDVLAFVTKAPKMGRELLPPKMNECKHPLGRLLNFT
jgi:hypothetical protein